MFLCMTEMSAIFGAMAITIICHIDEDRLRALITEMTTFVKDATDQESAVIRFYMRKCSLLHTMIVVVSCLGLGVYLLAPIVLPQPLPLKTAYPFSMEPFWIWALLYGSNVFTALQVVSSAFMSSIFVVLTWFAVARFDIVNTEIERASNLNEVNRCVRHHQESLKFASRLSKTVGRMAFAVAASNFAAVMFAGVVITFRQFYSLDFVKVLAFEMVSMVHLFLYAWPADYMAQSMYPDTTYKMRSLAQQSVSHLLQAQEINSILNEPGSVKTRKTNLKHASKNLFIHMLCGDDSNIPDEWKIENHSKRIV
nr:uncharacterized protein LOC124216912 [Neodiprion pinetum]